MHNRSLAYIDLLCEDIYHCYSICSIYKTSKSGLSDIKHKVIAKCFGSDKAHTASFANILLDESFYVLLQFCMKVWQSIFSKVKNTEESLRIKHTCLYHICRHGTVMIFLCIFLMNS